jgi:uncharacterized protein (TIGR00369 family)
MTVKNLMTAAEVEDLLRRVMPQATSNVKIVEIDGMTATVELKISDQHLRPGGTVSGPSMFLLADVAFYANLLSLIGPVPLAVTTSSTINFMRKPSPEGVVAISRIMKLGRQLAVGDVSIFSATDKRRSDPVAHATITYAIPPDKTKSKKA